MALNLSRQMYSNRFVIDGSPDRGGDGCAKPWHYSREVEDSFDYHSDRGGPKEAGKDILDVLPPDPFGMDISTTFTAITGWLEDLDYNVYGSNEAGASKGEYELLAGLNFVWNSSLRFHSLPVNFGVDEASFMDGRFGGDNAEQLSSSSACCGSVAATSSIDDIIHKLPTDYVFHQTQDDQSVSGACDDGDYDSPHQALYFALSYLGTQDLLATEGVCRSLRFTIKNDPLLWRNIHIEQPLNEKISDDVLIQLASRAQGKLQSLSLVECSMVTDGGMKHVLESNPRLTKLNVPGSTRLSIEGIINNLKAFSSSDKLGIKYLRIGGLYGVTQKHFDELKLLLANGKNLQQNPQKPHFFGRDTIYLPLDDDRSIDIEACPVCQSLRLVYDCPIKGCQGREGSRTCRGCTACIQRCIQCGQCINEDSVYIENFCLECLCIDCWDQLPKHYETVINDMCIDA
ncbi:unnamed protein product [Rhodiola kirilowii]